MNIIRKRVRLHGMNGKNMALLSGCNPYHRHCNGYIREFQTIIPGLSERSPDFRKKVRKKYD